LLVRLLTTAALVATFAIPSACSKPPAAAAAQPIVLADNTTPKTPDKAADFTLTDQNGKSHELYSLKDSAAIVLVMQGVGCPIVQQMTPQLKDTVAAYTGKKVTFMMLNSNIQDTPEMIKDEADKFDLKLPILKDQTQAVGMNLGAVRTAEVFVIQPKTWKILYHGPLDDRLTYGRAKAKADNHYVADVLDAMLAGKPVPVIHQQADGCIINFPTRQHA
jgi:peroxiredoxin